MVAALKAEEGQEIIFQPRVETLKAKGMMIVKRIQSGAACPPPPWPPSQLAEVESTPVQEGEAGRRKLHLLEVHKGAMRDEGVGQRVGGCQCETGTLLPIPAIS